jgi:hypothetical protein
MITVFLFLGLFSSSCRTTCQLRICVRFLAGFHGSYTLLTILGYINQVTTSLLHQLGAYPKEAASKVRSVWQLKVDSNRIFACFGGILRV